MPPDTFVQGREKFDIWKSFCGDTGKFDYLHRYGVTECFVDFSIKLSMKARSNLS